MDFDNDSSTDSDYDGDDGDSDIDYDFTVDGADFEVDFEVDSDGQDFEIDIDSDMDSDINMVGESDDPDFIDYDLDQETTQESIYEIEWERNRTLETGHEEEFDGDPEPEIEHDASVHEVDTGPHEVTDFDNIPPAEPDKPDDTTIRDVDPDYEDINEVRNKRSARNGDRSYWGSGNNLHGYSEDVEEVDASEDDEEGEEHWTQKLIRKIFGDDEEEDDDADEYESEYE